MTYVPAPSDEVSAYAEALRRLRERARGPDGRKVSQEALATAIGQRKQTLQLYESGKVQQILRPDVQDRLTRPLGMTREDLVREKETVLVERNPDYRPATAVDPATLQGRSPSPAGISLALPVWGRGKAGPRGAHIYDLNEPERWLDLASLYGPSCRAMQLIGDSMYPWAAHGTTIVYDLDRWPRREQGCVIETKSEGYFVKLYDRHDDEKLYVRELQPELRTIEFKRADVVGVYAVLDRIDR